MSDEENKGELRECCPSCHLPKELSNLFKDPSILELLKKGCGGKITIDLPPRMIIIGDE